MDLKLLMYAVLLWTLFFPFAIFNAGLREYFWTPRLGEHAGHIISTVTFLVALLIAIYMFLKFVNIRYSNVDLWIVGVTWFFFTILFEFGFGHYVMGNSWDALLRDYNVMEGRFWLFIPLTWLIAPRFINWLLES